MSSEPPEMLDAEQSRQIRARQAARSRVLALILAGMAVLFFAITVVKIGAMH